jgi:hypothetical protein
MWTVEETFSKRDDAMRAAGNLVSSGEKHVKVVSLETIYTTEKEFRTYKIFLDDLKKVRRFADALIHRQIWIEIVPSQTGMSDIIVHLRQGDYQQYRNMIDICIRQEILFDIHAYKKESGNE